MKLSDGEAFEEIKKRGAKIRQRHERRVTRVLGAVTAMLAVALVGVLSFYIGVGVEGSETTYGSFLLPAEAGGYVIAALVAFVLGVVITFFILHCRGKSEKEDDANAEKTN